MRAQFKLLGIACLAVAVAAPAIAGPKKPDAGLYTFYSLNFGQWLDFTVCGTFRDTYGCYGGQGFTDAMEQPCAVLEGPISYNGNTISRDFYALDRRTAEGAEVQLHVYHRVDTMNGDLYSVVANYVRTVGLGIPGGASANCSLAGNKPFIYAATNHTQQAARIDRKTFAVTLVGGGFTPAEFIDSITADDRGYISIRSSNATFGGFYIFDPKGNEPTVFSGGGGSDVVGFHNGGSLVTTGGGAPRHEVGLGNRRNRDAGIN